jgi:hypothetical protein
MKRKILSMMLTVIMVCGLLPVVATANTSNATRIQPGHRISETVMRINEGADHNFYYAVTMPYDGVLTLSFSQTCTSTTLGQFYILDDTGNDPSNRQLSSYFPEKNQEKTLQYYLRAGEYNIRLRANTRWIPSTPGSNTISFTYNVSKTIDGNWDKPLDAEPNDTEAQAIPLEPNTVATGAIGAMNLAADGSYAKDRQDSNDYYKFSVTSKADIELSAMGIDGQLRAYISRMGSDKFYTEGPHATGPGVRATLVYKNLEPGEYFIRVYFGGNTGAYIHNGNRGALAHSSAQTAYEISYNVLSGSVGGSSEPAPTPTPISGNFDYLNPIAQNGTIHFDQWNYSQHRGEFKDKDGKVYSGIGMFASGGSSGTSYVTYNIPASAGRFTTYISLDSVWCGTTAYGTSTFNILFDGISAFSKSFTQTFSAELIDIVIPQNANTITLQVQQQRGSSGNHAAFFGAPSFTSGARTPAPATPTPAPTSTPTPPPSSGGGLGGYKSESVNLVGIRLEWSPIFGSVGYRVYRSEARGQLGIPATDFYTIGHDFVDVNIRPNTTYYYTVRQILREATIYGDPETFGAESNQVEVRSPGTILGDNLHRPNTNAVKQVILMKIDDPMMTMANGSRQEIDPGRGTVPLIRNSRTLVPIRAIVEGMGGNVGYTAITREVSLRYGQQSVSMWLDNTSISVNGASKTMDVAPASINDRTMVPIRFAGENLGCAVEFINSTRQVVIVYYETSTSQAAPVQSSQPAPAPQPIRTTENSTASTSISPGTHRGKNNQALSYIITGSTSGTVWGSGTYTDDSNIAKAAVHAGIVAIGETKTVTIRIMLGQSSYPSTAANGITTLSYGSWGGSYEFVK